MKVRTEGDSSLILLLQPIVRPLLGEDLSLAVQEMRERTGGDSSQGQQPLPLPQVETLHHWEEAGLPGVVGLQRLLATLPAIIIDG